MSGSPSIGALPGNLLTLTDSDFESGIGSWVALTNATGVSLSTSWAWTGNNGLGWNASAAGDTSVTTGFYPIVPGKTHVASVIINPGAARVCQIGVNWYNGTTFLGSSASKPISVPDASGGWPLFLATGLPPSSSTGVYSDIYSDTYDALTTPANQAKVWVKVQGAASGEREKIDFVYFAPASVQILCDWYHAPFAPDSSAGTAFFDLTPFTRIDAGITMTRGRQDAVSTVQPGSATFNLWNTPGWFTVSDPNAGTPVKQGQWMSDGTNVHSCFLVDATTTRAFFDTTAAFISGGDPTTNPVQDGLAATPILNYTTYTQFLADVTGVSQTIGSNTYTPRVINTSVFQWVRYDIEGGATWTTDPTEKADPKTYITNFISTAHAHGFKCMITPGRDLGNSDTVHPKLTGESLDKWYVRVNVASWCANADAYEVQDQANQANALEFQNFYNTTRAQALAVNPSVPVWCGLSVTYGNGQVMYSSAQSVPNADGFWLNILGDTTDTLDFMGRVLSGRNVPPWAPNVKLGRRAQINVADETGTWHTRFDGPIAEFDYTYDDLGGCYTDVTVTDVLSWLSRLNGLSCWTKEQVLLDGPLYHWSLDERGGQSASDTSGNNGPTLRVRSYGLNSSGNAAATCTFASGNGGVETQANAPDATDLGKPNTAPINSAYFQTSLIPGSTTQSGSAQIEGQIPALSTRSGNNFAVEFWVTLDPGAFTSIYHSDAFALLCALSLGDTRTGKNFTLSMLTGSLGQSWLMQTWNSPLAQFLSSTVIAFKDVASTIPAGGVPIHFVLNVTGADSGATLTCWVNGAAGGSIALPKYFAPNWISIGGMFGGYDGWQGNISLVSIYPNTLNNANIQTHAALGSAGTYLYTTAQGVAVVSAFAEIPPFWTNLANASSLGIADYIDLTGQSALATMQLFEQAEVAGLLYANAAGQLSFDGRQVRMGAGAPDLTLPPGSYSADLGYKVTDQYLVTSASISSAAVSRGVTVGNPDTGSNDYGPYQDGSPQSPNAVSVLSQSPQYQLRGVAGETQVEPYMTDVAAWQVNRNSTPRFKAAQITVDALTLQDPASSAYVALSALYGVDINNILRLGGAGTASSLPSAGTLDCIIEGVSETIITNESASSHAISFYTSPAALARCWKPGDSTYGVLDSTAVIGIGQKMTGPNGPHTKNHNADPGDPFWPPSYASSMNSAGVTGKGFVGATDQRGIYYTLQVVQQPPLLIVGQSQTGANNPTSGSEQTVIWDTTYVDTESGMGAVIGWPNWYVIYKAGFYELHAVVNWALNGTGNRLAKFLVNPNGATQTPVGSSALVYAPTSRRASSSVPTAITLSARLYCGVGTTVGVRLWQDSAGPLSTSVSVANGSLFSVRFTGYSQTAD